MKRAKQNSETGEDPAAFLRTEKVIGWIVKEKDIDFVCETREFPLDDEQYAIERKHVESFTQKFATLYDEYWNRCIVNFIDSGWFPKKEPET